MRVGHFFELLVSHLQHKIKEWRGEFRHPIPVSASDESTRGGEEMKVVNAARGAEQLIAAGDQMLRALQRQFVQSQKDDERKKIFIQIAQLKIRQAWLYVTLGHYYLIRDDCPQAQKYYNAAFVYEPTNYGALTETGRCLELSSRCAEALPYFEKASQNDPETAILARDGIGALL